MRLRKLRKGLAVLLTAAMVVGLMPDMGITKVSAAESTEPQATDEASVTINGETLYYATLEEAFSAADGKTATITMLNDAEYINTSGVALRVANNSKITLDMNGKTLSGKVNGVGIINVGTSGSLLVQGPGTVKSTNIGLSCDSSFANMTVEDITVDVSAANSGVEIFIGTVTLNNVQITGKASKYAVDSNSSGNLTINNVSATETGYCDVHYDSSGTLKINGGTFDKISVESDNSGGITSVSQLLGEGCIYRYADKTWETADELNALEIQNVTVEKIPLTINPQAETSWYYNSAEHSLQMNAVPTTENNEITYEWYDGETKLECVSDTYTIPKTMSLGNYNYTCKATCDGYTLSHEFTFTVEECKHEDVEIDFNINGFGNCPECNEVVFQPAVETKDTYDINNDGIKDNVYEISNAGQLYWFADKVNNGNKNYGSANAVLTADITVNTGNVAGCNGTKEDSWIDWTPIGNSFANSYTGTFDGQGFTVSGLYFNNTNTERVGLFGYVGNVKDENGNVTSAGKVSNVGVVDSYFNGKMMVGGVCGMNYGTIKNSYNTGTVSGTGSGVGGVCGMNYGTITNSYNTGSVSSSSSSTYVGGVCGANYSGTIENCYNTGTVSGTGDYVGGVCGYNPGGTIKNCYNTNTVSGKNAVGGVCGMNSSGKITGCYNEGEVNGTGNTDFGGVCGYNPGGTITGCYNTGNVSGKSNVGGVSGDNTGTITNCYNTGTVSGTGDYVGGVCGRNYNGTIENCYYNSTVYSTGNPVGVSEGGTVGNNVLGKTTAQFNSGEVAYLLSQGCTIGEGESAVTYDGSVWKQNIDNGTADTYPVLDSTHGTVYTICPIKFSNDPNKTVAHIFELDKDDSTKHICAKCGLSEEHHSAYAVNSQTTGTSSIKVTCGDCGEELGTVTLSAPTGDLTYDGTAKTASVTNNVTGVTISNPTITYSKAEDTTFSGTPQDAGTYTASITLGTGEGAATVSVEFTIEKATPTISWGMLSGSTWVEINKIPVTYTGSEIAPDKLGVSPTVTLVNGETYSGEISYSYRVQGSSDAFTSGLPTEIGTYEVKASIAADGNYKEAASTVTLVVKWLNIVNSATLTDQGGKSLSGDDWWAQSVTFTAPNGFTISNSLTDSFGTSFVYNEQTGADGTEVTYYLKNSDGEIAQKTATVRIDKTAPNWTGDNCGISIKENWWNSLLSTISFGLFYKETVDVKVCANDSFSGIAAYYYYIDTTGTIKTAEELDDLSFTAYTGSVSGQNPTVTVTSLDAGKNYIVYAYAVDSVGNRSSYVCSDGVVVDNTAPAISDIVAPSKDDSTLKDTSAQISFTGSEAGTYFYMVKEGSDGAPSSITDFATENAGDGNSTWTAREGVSYASMTADADNKIMLSDLKANTAYTLYVATVDLAGNSTGETVTSLSFTTCKIMPVITVNPAISGTYGQTVEEMTLTNGTAKYGNTILTGTWSVSDENKLDRPGVGTTATYEVTFEPEDSQYETVTVQVTPTIAKKAVTVTADDKEKAYGEANPEFTFTVPAGVLVTGDAETDLAITLSCEAGVNSPVKEGGYAITGTSESANYDVTVTQGTLKIKKADAVINVEKANYEKTFGDATFNLGVTDTNTDIDVQYSVSDSKNVAGTTVEKDKVITVDAKGNVTIVGAGSGTITVTLSESTNYNAAGSKTITVNVAKADAPSIADVEKYYLHSAGSNGKNVTVDIAALLPTDRGTTTYGPVENNAAYVKDPAVSEEGKLTYQVAAQDSAGATTTLIVTATTENHENITVKVNITLTNKKVTVEKEGAKVAITGSNELTYGQKLSDLTLNTNTAKFVVDGTDEEITGTLAWTDPNAVLDAGTTTAQWIFTPEEENYTTLTGNLTIKVAQKVIKVNALDQVIYTDESLQTEGTDAIPVVSYEGFDGAEEQTAVINTADTPTVSAEGYNALSPAGNYVITVSNCGSVKDDAAKNYKLEKGNTATLAVIAKKSDTELPKIYDNEANSGTLDSVAVVETDAPKTDLAAITVTNVQTLLNDEEQSKVKSGSDALLYLKVSDAQNTVTSQEKAEVSKAANGDTVGKYLDLSLFLRIENSSNRQITDTKASAGGFNMKVTITIPDALRNVPTGYTRSYNVIRVHKGENGTLETTKLNPTKSGYNLTFETDKFSVYAITYKDTQTSIGGGGSSSGGSGSSSGGGGSISNVPVTGITVTPVNAILTKAGESVQLTAEVSPSYATNKNVTWTSDNEAVATVDSTGKVTAVGNGTATITATTQSGSKTATVVITVNIASEDNDKPSAPAETDKPSVPVETDKPSVIITPEPAETEKPPVSATPDVTVTPAAPTPTAEPTAPAESDTPKDTEAPEVSATPTVTATPKPTATPMKVTSDFRTLKARSEKQTKTTVTLKWAKVSKADGYLVYGSKCNTKEKKYTKKLLKTIKGNGTLTWTQKKLAKATFYKYQIKAYKLVDGKKVVIAQSVDVHTVTKGGKYSVAGAIKVTKLAGKKVSGTSLKLTVTKGKTAQIKATETPAEKNKTIKCHRALCYESSNKKVATVTKNGKIKAVGKGTCKIYVYAQNGVYKTITVTVK